MAHHLSLPSDDHVNWIAKDCSPTEARPSRAKDRPLLGVRRRGAAPAHGHLRLVCTLAGVHLVSHVTSIHIGGGGSRALHREKTSVSLLPPHSRPFVISYVFCSRYAIGTAERPRLAAKVGWLDALANETHQHYGPNGTGGPSIKVGLIMDEHTVHDLINHNDCLGSPPHATGLRLLVAQGSHHF